MTADLLERQRRIEERIAELAGWTKDNVTRDIDDLRTIVQALSVLQQELRTIEAQRRGEGILRWRT